MNKAEYFASPVYIEEKLEWLNQLDSLSDPFIKHAREEQKENNEQIIKVLSFILSKLDTLEIEQSKHKEMFYKVRKNLTDANDLINAMRV